MSFSASEAGIEMGIEMGLDVWSAAFAMVAQGAALAALAWAAWASGLLRRRPAVWAAIWTVVLVKLVLPWGPEVAGSLADLWALATRSDAAVPVPAVTTPLTGVAAAPGVSLGATLGVCLLAGWTFLSSRRLFAAFSQLRRQRRAVAALPAAPSWVTALSGELSLRFGCAAPTVVVHPEHVVPHLLYGLRRSYLVVPRTLLEEGQGALLELALAHELAHLRRRDPLARWLCAAVSAVWFFLPIGRLIGRPLERSQEVAADALALRVLDLPPPAYAQRLVDVTLRCQAASAAPALALARPGAPGALLDRVEALCLHRTTASAGWLGAAALLGFAVLGLGQARTFHSDTSSAACEFSPEIAAALREVHPEADRDGDGELGREEACALQEQLRRTAQEGLVPAEELASSSSSPLWQRLCCSCETSSSGAPEVRHEMRNEMRNEPLSDGAAPQACVQEP